VGTVYNLDDSLYFLEKQKTKEFLVG